MAAWLLLRGWTLLLLASVRADPGAPGQAERQSFTGARSVYIRYYGARGALFHDARSFPLDICDKLMAMCATVTVGQCQKTPPEFAAPYSMLSEGRPVWFAGRHGLGYMTLTLGRDPTRARLQSECDANCENCQRELAGIDLMNGGLGVCASTPERAVYMMIAGNHLADSENNLCVESLETYYFNLSMREKRYRAIITATGGILLILVCTFCFVSLCIQSPVTRPSKAISAEEIERVFPPHPGPCSSCHSEGIPTCVVCLGPIKEEEMHRRLQCGHNFHAECILEWWTHVPRATLECPTCRQSQQVPRMRTRSEDSRGISVTPQRSAASRGRVAVQDVETAAAELHSTVGVRPTLLGRTALEL